MTSDNENHEIPVLLSVRDFSKKHPFMSESALRFLLYKNEDGLEDCLVRVGRRVYINEKKFFDFLIPQKEKE